MGSWFRHAAAHECVAADTSGETKTFQECKVKCDGYTYMDWKHEDSASASGWGSTDGSHYCICSNSCALSANADYDVYANFAHALVQSEAFAAGQVCPCGPSESTLRKMPAGLVAENGIS